MAPPFLHGRPARDLAHDCPKNPSSFLLIPLRPRQSLDMITKFPPFLNSRIRGAVSRPNALSDPPLWSGGEGRGRLRVRT
jgi:hypothetical protein